MPTYYLYFLGANRRIQAREDLEAADDVSAIALADRRRDGRSLELWLGSRRVWTYDSAVPPAAS